MKTISTTQKSPTLCLLNRFSKKILAACFLILSSSVMYAQCVASFTAVDNGNGNYTFTNTSTGINSNTIYHWSIISNQYIYLGNSSNSVSYTFINGSHTIRLMISDSASNCNDSLSLTINVTSGQNCNINSGFTYTFGTTVNGSVNFQSTTTGNFASELWVYGDNSWGTNPNHTYWSNGSYVVSLIARDASQTCFDTTQQTITISNISSTCNPNLNFTYTDNGSGNFSFTNTSSNYNPSGYFSWNFGNGQTSWNLNPSHTYTANGTYNVSLIFVDSSLACYDTLIQQITVTGVIPPCTHIADFIYTDNGNGNFSFTSTSTGGLNHYWQFGDGNNAIVNNPNHTFAANGTYNVVLHIFDSLFNCVKWKSYTIIVNGINGTSICNAGYTMYLDSMTNNIIITNSSTGPNLSYFWNFGDGNTSTQAYPSYTYSTPGPFYLCLTVTDSINSCTSTYCDSIGSNGIVLKQTGFTINVQSPIVTSIDEATKNILVNWNIYPNPFKENVTIEFVLKDISTVEIFATDLIGNTVDVISNEMMQSGINNVKWNANKLSNGIYLITIKTENSLQVKKIVLNR